VVTTPRARQKEVDEIYTSTDISEIQSILDKYQIKYIFVGLKNMKISNLNVDNFSQLGAKVVFTLATRLFIKLINEK